jgi:hypothetical protein
MLDPKDRVVSVRIKSAPALCRLKGDSRPGAAERMRLLATRLGTRCQFAARMLMPKAAVNKTTSLCFGSTMSGFPGKSRRCSRNRNPIARPKT